LSTQDLVSYIEEVAFLRKMASTAVNRWKIDSAAFITLKKFASPLLDLESRSVSEKLESGYFTTPTGFIDQEELNQKPSSSLGFVSQAYGKFSDDALGILEDFETELSSDSKSFGKLARPGFCNGCNVKVSKDTIACENCFAPCISMLTFNGRSAYGEVMHELGEKLAREDSPKFDLWHREMTAMLEYMKSEQETLARTFRKSGQVVSSSQVFWLASGVLSLVAFLSAFSTSSSAGSGWVNGILSALIILLPSAFGFFSVYVRCTSCRKYCVAKISRLERDWVGTQEGTHTEYQLTATWTDFSDSRGHHLGSASSLSATPERVSHVSNVYSDTHECPFCGAFFATRVVKRS
jgi:hypothetical protein